MFFLILIAQTGLFAQNDYSFQQYFDETRELIQQPGKWKAKDWLILGGIIGATYGLIHVDEDVRDVMLKDRSYENSIPMLFGTYYGEPITPIILGSILLIHGNSRHNKANKKLGFEIWQAYSYAIISTSILKISFGRARPSTGSNAFDFNPPCFSSNDYWSLNSGHASIAFSLSTVLAENTDKTFLKILYYIPAVITGFSRVYHNKHWTSDVFLGAAIGFLMGKYVTELHEEKEKEFNLTQPGQPILSFSISF